MMKELHEITEELEALGQKELSNEIKTVAAPEERDLVIEGQIKALMEQTKNYLNILNTDLKNYKTYDEKDKKDLKEWLNNLESKLTSI